MKYSSEKENNYAANYKVCCKQSAATSETLSANVFVTIYCRVAKDAACARAIWSHKHLQESKNNRKALYLVVVFTRSWPL